MITQTIPLVKSVANGDDCMCCGATGPLLPVYFCLLYIRAILEHQDIMTASAVNTEQVGVLRASLGKDKQVLLDMTCRQNTVVMPQ